jgi:drug/metabolite transporter (DMT)-like permease
LNPVFTVLLLPLIGERLPRRGFAGVLVALGGAAAVITRGELASVTAIELNSGDLLALVAAACWAAFNLASRGAVARLSPAFTNAVVYGVGAVALAALGSGEDLWGAIGRASPAALSGILIMAVFSSVVAGQLFLIGVRNLGVSRSVAFVYLVPVLTAALSAIVLHEQLSSAQVLGGAAVLLGVYLSTGR